MLNRKHFCKVVNSNAPYKNMYWYSLCQWLFTAVSHPTALEMLKVLKSFSLPEAFSSLPIFVPLLHVAFAFPFLPLWSLNRKNTFRINSAILWLCPVQPGTCRISSHPALITVFYMVFVGDWPWRCPFRQSSLKSTWWPIPQAPTMWTLMQSGMGIRLPSKYSAKYL